MVDAIRVAGDRAQYLCVVREPRVDPIDVAVAADTEVVWQLADPKLAIAVQAISILGWGIVLLSTFLINHFELFGLHQVATNLAGRAAAEPHSKLRCSTRWCGIQSISASSSRSGRRR